MFLVYFNFDMCQQKQHIDIKTLHGSLVNWPINNLTVDSGYSFVICLLTEAFLRPEKWLHNLHINNEIVHLVCVKIFLLLFLWIV